MADFPQHPIGTVAEVEELGLDVAVFHTCARPAAGGMNPDGTTRWIVRGCDAFDGEKAGANVGRQGGEIIRKCNLSIKGVSGPEVFAIRIHDGETKKATTHCVNCWWIAQRREDIHRNGGLLKIIAKGGQKYKAVTGMKDPANPTKSITKEYELVVPSVRRPKNNPDVLEFAAHGAAQVEAKLMEEMEHGSKFFGGSTGFLDAGLEDGGGSAQGAGG